MLAELDHHPLIFPRLLHLREATLRPPKSSKPGKRVQLFKLDWDGWENRIRARWRAHEARTVDVGYVDVGHRIEAVALAKPKPNRFAKAMAKLGHPEPVFAWALPEKWDTVIKGLVFGLHGHYLDGIRHAAKMALTEWNYPYRFDTAVCDECVQPAIAFAWVAFYLLSDCIYDTEAHYFDWDFALRTVALHAMVYKVWDHQTGRGCLWDHAKMDQACEHLDRVLNPKPRPEWLPAAKPRKGSGVADPRPQDWTLLKAFCEEIRAQEFPPGA